VPAAASLATALRASLGWCESAWLLCGCFVIFVVANKEKKRIIFVFIDDYLNYNNHLIYFVYNKMMIIDLYNMEMVQMMMMSY